MSDGQNNASLIEIFVYIIKLYYRLGIWKDKYCFLYATVQMERNPTKGGIYLTTIGLLCAFNHANIY